MPRAAERIAGHLSLSGPEPCERRTERRSMVLIRQPTDSETINGKKRHRYSICSDVRSVHSPAVVSVRETEDGDLVVEDEPVVLTILENTNVDGVRHLQSEKPLTKYMWAAIIIVFVLLACIQIWSQIKMYITTPVATNIEASYPSKIIFPAVAICNNNQYRLTFLTGRYVQERHPKEPLYEKKTYRENENATVYDKVIENAWDLDAVKFLRLAAHWKSRMILGCTWPNGTDCRLEDFHAVWTLTGLCWAINTNPNNPYMITASGSGHGLKLLLNIERYERIESCTPTFRTRSLPGLKILIYNQTDVPQSSLDGVNVPPGYSMDIPFRMQLRKKFPSSGCVVETEEQKARVLPFEHKDNIHTCIIREYLAEVETRCGCSMIRAYNTSAVRSNYNFCNVRQYFTCVRNIMEKRSIRSSKRLSCVASCDQIDYIAWQDMNLLPNNIFPSLIETAEEEDVEDVIDEYDENSVKEMSSMNRDELFQCEGSQLLSDRQVKLIKAYARNAYEKQSRYQEDIQLRTKRLIAKLRESTQNLIDLGWGWREKTYVGAFYRLNSSLSCYRNLSIFHKDIASAIVGAAIPNEETRTANLLRLISAKDFEENPSRYKTITELKERYGERVDEVHQDMKAMAYIIGNMWKMYDRTTFTSTLGQSVHRMDTILDLVEQYEERRLQRRAWAEKMQSRNMRHFFEQDFYEGWYNPTLKDLDESLVREITEMEKKDIPYLLNSTINGTGSQIGSTLYFGDTTSEHQEQFNAFLKDIIDCTVNEVKNESTALLKSFKKAMHEFQSAYTNLFKKELPGYLANFDFGSKFVEQNFAMVNVFLHKMNVEIWTQDSTYSIWSLACDVGGALGLFLGASLLTIIEIVYLCFHYGVASKLPKLLRLGQKNIKISDRWRRKKESGGKKTQQMLQKSKLLSEAEQLNKFLSDSYHEAMKEKDIKKPFLVPAAEEVLVPHDEFNFGNSSEEEQLRFASDTESNPAFSFGIVPGLLSSPLHFLDEHQSSNIENPEDSCEGQNDESSLLQPESSPEGSNSSASDQPALFLPISERQSVV